MDFFHELQLITRAYLEINGLPPMNTVAPQPSTAEARPAPSHAQTADCGFDRNGSHNVGHYVCMCGWEDVGQGGIASAATPDIPAPRTSQEWAEYGKRFPNW